MSIELIFSIALAGFTLFGVAYQIRELLLARASIAWPAYEAVVIDARVRVRRGRRSSYEPAITYRYSYRKREYTGHRITFGYLTQDSTEAEQLKERFAVGTHWEVRVCERSPELCVPHPGTTQRLWYGILLWSVFTIAAIGFLLTILGRLP
jgi:hypothetical protein